MQVLAAVTLGLSLSALAAEPAVRPAPAYSASSLVNAASNEPGPVAPNTIVSLYGTDLAWAVRALEARDMQGATMPVILSGSGVRVAVANIAAHIYFVSPRQVNLLIPSTLRPGPVELQLALDGRLGPAIRFTLSAAAPALFLQGQGVAIATSVAGGLYTAESPARPGDWVILYAAGLGVTRPAAAYGEIARGAAPLADMDQFFILLNGEAVDRSRIAYAGLAPGFAGLYQINLQLPESSPPDPEITIVAASIASPPGVRLPVR